MNHDIIKQISLLYELSLNIGKSLCIKENTEEFLKILMSRKGLEYSALWVKKEDNATFECVYNNPNIHEYSDVIIDNNINDKILFNDQAKELNLSNYALNEGEYVIVRLDDVALLELYSNQKTPVLSEQDLNKLNFVFEKFTRSIHACINYEHLQEARIKAEAMVKAKEQFLANMSHEIRTPMNAILGMAKLLEITELHDKQQEYVDVISASTHGLLRIINDILDLSKLEAEMLVFNDDEIELSSLIEDVKLAQYYKAKQKRIKYEVNANFEDNLVIIGDDVRIKQVLINLLSNSVKFTEQGSVCLDIDVVEESLTDIQLKFTVSDTGKGIHPDNLKLIFNNFQQEDSGITRKYGGTGLGLSITKNILDRQNAKLHIESEIDEGSVFTIHWTFKKGEAKIEKKKKTLEEINPNLKILVAEDNPFNQSLMISMFEIDNIKIDVVDNGKLAIDAMKNKSYDIVFMDIHMPEMGGEEAMGHIREFSDIPIIALTANALKGSKDIYLSKGFNGYLSKPCFLDDIHHLLNEIL